MKVISFLDGVISFLAVILMLLVARWWFALPDEPNTYKITVKEKHPGYVVGKDSFGEVNDYFPLNSDQILTHRNKDVFDQENHKLFDSIKIGDCLLARTHQGIISLEKRFIHAQCS